MAKKNNNLKNFFFNKIISPVRVRYKIWDLVKNKVINQMFFYHFSRGEKKFKINIKSNYLSYYFNMSISNTKYKNNLNLKEQNPHYLLPHALNLLNFTRSDTRGEKKEENINGLEKKEDNIFGYYLAGLIEGDGYISLNNQERFILGITFNIKNNHLANFLLEFINIDGVIAKRKTKSVELRFSSKKSLLKIIQLINGKFRTPKIDQLYKLID